MSGPQRTRVVVMCCPLWTMLLVAVVAADKPAAPIAIAELKRDTPVDFEREVLPILAKNCLACHNARKAENGLVLESPTAILKGGDAGPAVAAGKGAQSLLIKVASHQDEPTMPPADNNVGAAPLKPEELALVKLWIDQGATGQLTQSAPLKWQPLPPGVNPMYAVAMSPDGRYVACGRANQIFVYHLLSGRLMARLTDPELLKSGLYERHGVAHRDLVQSLAFSPDGELLASGAYREVKLWSRPQNVRRAEWTLPTEAAQSLAVSPDGAFAATGDPTGTITVWNLASGKPEKTIAAHTAGVTGLAYTAKGERLVSSSLDQSVGVWNPADGAPLGRIDTPAPINALALSADGQRLATGGADKSVRLWSIPTGPLRDVVEIAGPVSALAASPDKKTIAVAGADGTIFLVDAAAGKAGKTLAGRKIAVTSLSFSGDGGRLAAAETDGLVRVWNVATGAPVAQLRGAVAVSVAIDSSGNALAAGTAEGKLTLWKLDLPAPAKFGPDAETGATASAISGDGKRWALGGLSAGKPAIMIRELAGGTVVAVLVGHEGPITALAMNQDGTSVVSGSADKTARVWNVAESKELAKYSGHGGAVTSIGLVAAGTQVASGAADNSLKLWNAADGAEIKNFAGHMAPIVALSLSANGQTLVSAAEEKTVRIWNMADGAQARAIEIPAAATALALTRDDSRVAVALADGTARLYQFADGKDLGTLTIGPTKSLAMSADSARLLVLGQQQAHVWDLASGSLLESAPAEGGCGAAALVGPTELVWLSADKQLMKYTLHAQRALVGPTKRVTGLAYRAASTILFAASEDGLLRAFQTTDGQQSFGANNNAPIHALALSSDGKLLATAGEDKQVKLWNADNGALAAHPLLAGFTGPVKCVTFTLDSAHVIAAGAVPSAGAAPAAGAVTQEVLAFGVATGAVEQQLRPQASAVTGVVATGEKETVTLLAAANGSVKLWPMAAGSVVAQSPAAVAEVSFATNDPNALLFASQDGAIFRWNLQTGQQTWQTNHGGPVTALAMRPDGQQFATTGATNIRLWKFENGQPWTMANNQPIPELKGDDRAQLQVARVERALTVSTAKNADSKKAVTDAEAKVTATAEGIKAATTAKETAAKALTEKNEAVKAPLAAKEAADKELEVAVAAVKAAQEAAAKAKEAADKDPQNAELGKARDEAKKVADEAERKRQEAEKKARDLGVPAAKAQQEAATADAVSMAAERYTVLAAELNAKAIAAVPVAQAAVKTAEAALASVQAELDQAKKLAASRETPFRSIVYSPDNTQFAVGGDNQVVRTFASDSAAPEESFAGHQGAITGLAFAPAGQLVSIAADKTGIVWDTQPAWNLQRTIGNEDDPSLLVDRVLSLAFSPDGKLLATGGGEPARSGELKLWGTLDGKLVRAITPSHSDTIFGLAFSPDGLFLASSSADRFVKVFDVNAGTLARSLEGHTHHVLAVAWRTDGKLLASGGADNVIKIWDFASGEQKLTTQPLPKEVTSLEFVFATPRLLVSCGDRNVRLYNSDNGNSERNYGGPSDFLYTLRVTPDGKTVVAGCQDSKLYEWNVENGQIIRTFDAPPPEVAAPDVAGKTAGQP